MLNLKLKTALLSSTISATLLLPVSAFASVPDYSTNVTSLVNYLKANQDSSGQITGFGGETAWAVMGLAANGIDPHTVQNGGISVVDFLKNNPPAAASATGWARDLLAVTAAGENPFTFGGHNYVATLQGFANANQLGSTTGLNDDTFGILALLSAGTSANQTIISDSVTFVINNQNVDGGWSYAVGNTSDNGDTAITIQALQAAKDAGFTNTGLTTAINTGVAYLKANQNSDGGWGYAGFGGSDAGTTAWATLAILGDDIEVTKALDFIVSKQDVTSGGVDGGFGVDTYTSANSLIAFGQKAFPVGNFDGTFTEPEPTPQPTPGDNTQNQNNNQNSNNTQNNGRVLASTDNNNQGKVLAATLPDTATIPTLADMVPSINYKPTPISVNYVLLIGLVALEVGLVLKLVAGRLKKNIVE